MISLLSFTPFKKQLMQACMYGLLLPLGFAPFHYPVFAFIGLLLFYRQLLHKNQTSSFLLGLFFGLGYFGFGISWIYVSIHDYGHLYGLFAACITFFFLLYLSAFVGLTSYLFNRLVNARPSVYCAFLFSSLWGISEYLRATLFNGFPWLLVGYSLFDTPFNAILPLFGVFGASFLACLLIALSGNCLALGKVKCFPQAVFLFVILLFSWALQSISWGHLSDKSLSVGVVQANLSMRDKWDETLFWQLLQRYHDETEALLGTDLIVLPESAIPLPALYLGDFLDDLHKKARAAGSAILLGIPEPTSVDESYYFNTLIGLGKAKGTYIKQHLVPFGEYIPNFIRPLTNYLGLPDANLKAGKKNQTLVRVHHHPVAVLICYELAFSHLIRQQLPAAEWIVSISDDGWFGHSLAVYQHQQMAQVLSRMTARYQVVANNDGLSSIIDTHGIITASLPAFRDGRMQAKLVPASGQTLWARWGDFPILIFACLIVIFYAVYHQLMMKEHQLSIAAEDKRRYPYQPH